MRRDVVAAAFDAEAERLSAQMAALEPREWARPTACAPWTAAELLGHVTVVLDWLPGMLAADAPPAAEVSAAGYYRADARFSPEADARRIALARERAAAGGGGPAVARDFDAVWRRVSRLCRREPDDRVVRTRHGDAMLLTDFLVTRVVEVGVHGLDLAAAVGRPPWLTEPAADLLTRLLLGPSGPERIRALGWDRTAFLRRATGREPMPPAQTAEAERAGIRWLALG